MPSTKRNGCAHSGVTLWGWAVPTLGLQGVSHALRQAQWLCPPRGHTLGTGSASLGLAGGPHALCQARWLCPPRDHTPGTGSASLGLAGGPHALCQARWLCPPRGHTPGTGSASLGLAGGPPCPLPSAMAVPTPGSHSGDGQCQPCPLPTSAALGSAGSDRSLRSSSTEESGDGFLLRKDSKRRATLRRVLTAEAAGIVAALQESQVGAGCRCGEGGSAQQLGMAAAPERFLGPPRARRAPGWARSISPSC